MSTSAQRAARLADVDRSSSHALEAMHEEHDRLRGRLFEAIEAFGLVQRQEDAAKRLIRRITYESQARLEAILRERN